MARYVNHPAAFTALQWRLSVSRNCVDVGEAFEVILTVENRHVSEPLSATFHLHPPRSAITLSHSANMAAANVDHLTPTGPYKPERLVIEGLEAGASQTFTWAYRMFEGGRALFWAWLGEEPLPERRQSCCVLALGAGYYSGDTHNHSTWSDGQSTLAENRGSVLSKGHSFLYSTDHNTLKHAGEVAALSAEDSRIVFCHAAGWEFTSGFGHALAYGYNQVYNPKKITSRGNLAEWQAFVDEAVKHGAIVYLAHPYEAPKYEFGDEVLYGIRGITGIEVWNGFNHHALHEPNRKAFDAWDNLNSRGDRRYYGNAVSDAHAAPRQGDPYMKGWMDEPNVENVHRLLATGAFFGSNGPEVDLRIGTASMGGVYVLPNSESSGRAVFQIRAFDPFGRLQRVTLYRNAIHPQGLPQHRREVAFETETFAGEERSLFVRHLELPVVSGEFYRAEVRSRYGASGEGGRGIGQGTGFAYTNPIWVK